MRHFEVIGDTGRKIGQIWAKDETAAHAIADVLYASMAYSVRAAFTWEETHAA